MDEVTFNAFVSAALIGGGLVYCGYLLGKASGYTKGIWEIFNHLVEAKFIDPEKILIYYANTGNQRARDALTEINRMKKDLKNKSNNNE